MLYNRSTVSTHGADDPSNTRPGMLTVTCCQPDRYATNSLAEKEHERRKEGKRQGEGGRRKITALNKDFICGDPDENKRSRVQ